MKNALTFPAERSSRATEQSSLANKFSERKKSAASLFVRFEVDGHEYWKCTKCGKIVQKTSREDHIERKHPELPSIYSRFDSTPTPDKIREKWVRWYMSGVHRVDLEAKIEEDLQRVTAGALESEIKRIVAVTGQEATCPRCGYVRRRMSRTGGYARCPKCHYLYAEEVI